MALAAALPPHPLKERATLFTVGGVGTVHFGHDSVPMLARAGAGRPAGRHLLGATIHDGAQVVGAGYSMSQKVGDIATLVKLVRVATLLPVILFAVAFTRITGVTTKTGDGPRPPPLPWFAVGFAALGVINSKGGCPRA